VAKVNVQIRVATGSNELKPAPQASRKSWLILPQIYS
jgi:hypothetical protein